MRPKGYLVFHLNLAFSSIEKEAWPDVVQKCYWPLLDLIEEMAIPIGIELTGWTLKQIETIDIGWVKRFKSLLVAEACELIGSGYCQIIGPLVPHKVNQWNQRLGLKEYDRILGVRPTIALVNEMAYSSSLIELYQQFGYRGFITDRDNTRLALGLDKHPSMLLPTHAKGHSDSLLPVLWSDSMLFQRVQHYAHGDITAANYIDYVRRRCIDGETLLPIYCNDAEVFDYRPGRFVEERPTHKDGEWYRIKMLLRSLEEQLDIEWVKPTDALCLNDKGPSPMQGELTSAKHPIAVKKQTKYNIARWAVTGRNDLWLNTMCHRIAAHLDETNNDNHEVWRELCELWASDLRTHITEKRWNEAKKQLDLSLNCHKISNTLDKTSVEVKQHDSLEDAVGNYGGALIQIDDGIFLTISTEKIRLTLNLRRGLCIHNLSFSSHDMIPSIGTIPYGYFSSIALGADYYSGGIVIELPAERRRVTDLENVVPQFRLENNGDIKIQSVVKTSLGVIVKTIKVSATSECITISYDFPNWGEFTGSVRLGTVTLLDDFSHKGLEILCKNGGDTYESFLVDGEIHHTSPASSLVSSRGGFGATTGEMIIKTQDKQLNLSWDPCECAVMPMFQHTPSAPNALSRLFFSMSELDDTKKCPSVPVSFSLNISADSLAD